MTTDAARRAVLDTAELLENIMMQLPPRKIFVIQRVCKQFRDIVANSVKLQQRLFLRSDGTEAQEWRVAVKRNDYRWPITGRYVKSTDILEADENAGEAFKPVRLGHALEQYSTDETIRTAYFSVEQLLQFRQDFDFFGESSLAKTYLAHPPKQLAILELELCYKSDSKMYYSGRVEVSRPDGLKVADLLHAIRCSKFEHIRRRETATHEAKIFRNASLQDVTGDENFLDKTRFYSKMMSIYLPNCIAPTEEEWAAMAG